MKIIPCASLLVFLCIQHAVAVEPSLDGGGLRKHSGRRSLFGILGNVINAIFPTNAPPYFESGGCFFVTDDGQGGGTIERSEQGVANECGNYYEYHKSRHDYGTNSGTTFQFDYDSGVGDDALICVATFNPDNNDFGNWECFQARDRVSQGDSVLLRINNDKMTFVRNICTWKDQAADREQIDLNSDLEYHVVVGIKRGSGAKLSYTEGFECEY